MMAVEKINNKRKPSTLTTSTSKLTSLGKTLFFHYKYHPRDVVRKAIRNAYKNICESKNAQGYSFKSTVNISNGEELTIDQLTVCYSRPRNLRDELVSSKLFETPTYNVRNCIDKI